MSTIQTEPAADAARAPLALTRRDRWIDLCLVVGVALWQPILSSTLHVLQPGGSGSASNSVAVHGLLFEISGLAVLAYVLWKRGAGMGTLTRGPRWRDIPMGVALCILVLMVSGVGSVTLRYAWMAVVGHPPAQPNIPAMMGMQASAAWLIYLLVNPWFEEIVVRGFLMTEVTALAGMRTAVVVSTLVQVSYHLYQGWFNAAGIAIVFLGFSLYYASTRRLLPVVVAHTVMDLLSYGYFVHPHR